MISNGTIELRAPEPFDIDDMYRWENDESIWAEGSQRAPMSRKTLADYVNCYNPDPNAAGQLRLVIELSDTGEAIGCVDLYEYDSFNRRSGVGIVIDSAHQHKGYGRMALCLLADYARKHLGLHQLWAIVSRENAASGAMFEACGFRSCGSLRSWIRIGTTWHDALMYQLLL